MIQIQLADINFSTILRKNFRMIIVYTYILSKNNIALIILKKKQNEQEITFGITWGGSVQWNADLVRGVVCDPHILNIFYFLCRFFELNRIVIKKKIEDCSFQQKLSTESKMKYLIQI